MMNKENDDVEILSFDDEAEEFMLNDSKTKEEPIIFAEDNIVDTQEEKDDQDGVELDELIKEVAKEEPIDHKKKEKILKKIKKEHKKDKKNNEKKPTNKKVFIAQVIFCTISVLFILGCTIFYGSRMIKFYKIYNPKTDNGKTVELLGTTIASNASFVTEGDGLYHISGAYLYKGVDVNNYVKFSNTLWRIIKINSDGSIEMATDSYVNALDWNSKITDYHSSDIRSYLNTVYLKTLNKDLLTNVSYCTDLVSDLSSATCNNTNSDDYVRLMGITEFLNSEVSSKTFLADNDNSIWLYNSSDKAVWHTSGNGLGTSDADSGYLVKAVVHVKNSAQLLSGKGTKTNPYVIEKANSKVAVGSYVKLGDDNWVVYEVDKNSIKLALKANLSLTYRYSLDDNTFNVNASDSLANYLNTTYYESLSYKNLLLDTVWSNGSYTSYKDVTKNTVNSKVGLMNVSDVKTNNLDPSTSYYLITPGDDGYEYMASSTLRQSKITISRGVKPAISINLTKIESGKGTETDPYVLED